MMSLRPAISRKRDDDRVLPLINVVFLLLIFFMLAGRFAETDPFDLEPPKSISEAPDDPGLIIVQFGKKGEVAIEGEVIANEELDQALLERFASGSTKGVRIKAHAAASAQEVIQLLARFSDAGFEDLKLMTVVKRP